MNISGGMRKSVRVPVWALAVTVVAFAAVIGLWGNAKWARAKWQDDDAAKAAQVASLTGNVADLTAARDQAKSDLEASQSALTKTQAQLQPQEVMAAKETALQGRETAVTQREADVKAREDAVTATEQQIAATTITEGMWTVGADIQPGTYRTKEPVTSDCYWAIYRSGTNGDDIIQNDIVTGGSPRVTLSNGQDFKTERCGDWVRQ